MTVDCAVAWHTTVSKAEERTDTQQTLLLQTELHIPENATLKLAHTDLQTG